MAIPSITHNSPSPGYISWGAFTIQLNGVAYSVGAASTNQRWVWWEYRNGSPMINAGPDVPATLSDDDLVLFANKNGLGVRVQSSNFVDGELLVDGTIFSDALSTNIVQTKHVATEGLDAGVIKFGEMSGDRIAVGSLESDRIIVGGGDNTPFLESVQQEAEEYVKSRATDLVTNGTGYRKNNTNFSAFDADLTGAPTGATAAFVIKYTGARSATIDELIPYDPTKSYQYSFQARQTVPGSTERLYGFIAPYDAQGRAVTPSTTYFWGGTTTTLAAPLNNGDTVIQLTSAANWYGSSTKPAGNGTYNRSMIIWNWTDEDGKTWPQHTYSRNYWAADTWADGGISGNTITLKAPWQGGSFPAGHPVSNGSSGGTYMYMPSAANIVIPETWTKITDAFTAGVRPTSLSLGNQNASGWDIGVPPGTAQLKVGWLLNYAASPANAIQGKHAVAAVSFSDATAASQKALEAFVRWAPEGVTTINGSNITTGTISTVHIATVGLDAAVVKFGAMSGDRILAQTISSAHVVAVGLDAGVVKFGSMSGDRITAKTINTGHVVTGGLDASVVKFGTMSGDRITAYTINSAHVVTTGLDAAVIKFGTMSGDRISAASITADKLSIGSINDNMAANPNFQDGLNGFVILDGSSGSPYVSARPEFPGGKAAILTSPGNGTYNSIGTKTFPIRGGATYYGGCLAGVNGNGSGSANLLVRFGWYDGNMNRIGEDICYGGYSAGAGKLKDGWTWSNQTQYGAAKKAPANARFGRLEMYCYPPTSTAGQDAYIFINGVQFRQAITGDILVDGAVDGQTITGATVRTSASNGIVLENDGSGGIMTFLYGRGEANHGYIQPTWMGGPSVYISAGAYQSDVAPAYIFITGTGNPAESGYNPTSRIELYADKATLPPTSVNGAFSASGNITGDAVIANASVSVKAPTQGSYTANVNWNSSNGYLRVNTSSARYKVNIQDSDIDPALVLALRPKRFQRNDEIDENGDPLPPGPWYDGFIAEEAAGRGLEEFVLRDKEGRPWSFAYDYFAAVGHQVVLRKHESEIQDLKRSLSDALERIEVLERNAA